MERCSVKPYKGEKPYIFISYSHKDKKYVFPVVERLVQSGYRVWYDEGIEPGAEWPERIAFYLNGCSTCMAFITDNYMKSQNCRRELNFAISKRKEFISVMLEEVNMSLGIELQLSTTQAIFKHLLNSEDEFYQKLNDAPCLKECIELQGDSRVTTEHTVTIAEPDVKPVAAQVIEPVEPPPVQKIDVGTAWLWRAKTNEQIALQVGVTKLGRSAAMSDYVILDNSAIGRFHAYIENDGNICKLIDNNSVNKTYINEQQIVPCTGYILNDGDTVRFANEKFTFMQKKRGR